jgi:hypothetical protein
VYDLNDIGYARERLTDTIVRYNRRAVWVKHITGQGKVTFEYLSTGTRRTCELHELNLKSPLLGYVNTEKSPSYVVRRPMRRDWRQGLRHNNLTCIGYNARDIRGIPNADLARTIKGRYPNFKEVMESYELGDVKGLAWSRQWALVKGAVWYKGLKVGAIKRGAPKLSGPYTYLQESLEESIK